MCEVSEKRARVRERESSVSTVEDDPTFTRPRGVAVLR